MIKRLRKTLNLNKDPGVAKKLKKCLEKALALEDYLDEMCPEETKLQKTIRHDVMREAWEEHHKNGLAMDVYFPELMNSRDGAQFVRTILEIGKAKRVLELGTFAGYSLALFCSIPSVEEVTALELDPFLIKYVKSHFAGTGEEKKLRMLEGPALESLKTLKDGRETFDAAFIDADKVNYLNYYKFIMDYNLIGSGGLIIADNTLYRGLMYPRPQGEMGQVFADFNSYVAKDERVTQVIAQVSDGISIIRRK